MAGLMNGLITYYAQRAFMLSKNTGVLALTLVPPVIVNFTLNLLLIPKHGLMGAVWATLWAYGLGLIIAFIVARRYFPLPIPLKALALCSFACAVMAGAVLALPDMSALPVLAVLLIKAGVGACSYSLVVFATNAANCRDLVIDLKAKFKNRNHGETAEA